MRVQCTLILCSLIYLANCQEDLNELYAEVLQYLEDVSEYELPKDNTLLLETDDNEIYDYGTGDFIIIGAGASGCVLTNRLSEEPDWTVFLFEAGGRGTNVTAIPDMAVYSIKTPYNWGYYTTPQNECCLGMENHQCMFPRGKAEGGSSQINALFYVRGNPDDYDQWEKLGNSGWSYKDVLPYFRKSEHADFPNADPQYHGLNGPLHVNYTTPPSVIDSTFFESATYNMGLDTIDYNAEKQIGVSNLQSAVNFNKRQDAGTVFVRPIENRSNVKVEYNCFVTKIIIKGSRAIGVEFVLNRKHYKAYARKEVIVSAGAINSVQLLWLSGIGPRKDLERLGIRVQKDLPVGSTLWDHPAFIGLTFSFKNRAKAPSLLDTLKLYLEGKAPLTRVFNAEYLGFVNVNNPNSTVPDIEFAVFPQPRNLNLQFLFNLNNQNAEAFLSLDSEVTAQVMVALLHPKSKGKVYLTSNSSFHFPKVDLGFYTDKHNEDFKTMYKGLKYVIDFFTSKAFGNIDSYISYKSPNCEYLGLFTEDYWYCALKELTTSFFHPVGTTKMGLCKKDSVVTSKLMVHGMKNLRVAGEGVYPRTTSGHTYAPCLMIGEKLSDIIKKNFDRLNGKSSVYVSKRKSRRGSSQINALFYVRGNPDDYDQWEKLGNSGWSYKDVLPYFRKSEHADFPNADPQYHGLNGPLHVNYTTPPSVIDSTFFESATNNMGLDTIDYNAEKQIGVSNVQSAINFNKRQDAGTVFVRPIENRRNVKVKYNCFVTKIIIKGNRAIGVEFVLNRKHYRAYATKEVIVSAGAINSVQLLWLSGIGPRKYLERLGIRVRKDLPVGSTLWDHPVFMGLTFSFKNRAKAPSLLDSLKLYLEGKAPLTRVFNAESLGFVNVNNPNSTVPDIEFAVSQPRNLNLQFPFNLNNHTAGAFLSLDPEVTAQVMVALLHPKSKGKVYLTSNSSLHFPKVDLGFYTDKHNEDLKTMYKGLKYVIDFFTGKAFGNIDSYISYKSPDCEYLGLFTEDYWYCALKELTTTFFHPVGTTKMGLCKKTSVVTSKLMVHGMKNLRVAGEGVYPRTTSGHTYAPCLMIGEKLSDIIKKKFDRL